MQCAGPPGTNEIVFRLVFRKFELREARLLRSRVLPRAPSLPANAVGVDPVRLGLTSLHPQQIDPLRPGRRGQPALHTASLAPRGPAAFACQTGGTVPSRSRQESFAARPCCSAGRAGPTTLRALCRAMCLDPRGNVQHSRPEPPANQQTIRFGPSAATSLMRVVRQKTRMYAPEEDDPVC